MGLHFSFCRSFRACFFVLYSYPGVRSLTGPYPPGYVPAGLSAPYALSGLVFVITPWAYSVSSLSGRKKAVAKLFSTLTENHHKLYIFICIQMVFSLAPRDLKIALPILHRLSAMGLLLTFFEVLQQPLKALSALNVPDIEIYMEKFNNL